jgi:hypothetical protein
MIRVPVTQDEGHMLELLLLQECPHLFPEVSLAAVDQDCVLLVVIDNCGVTASVFIGLLGQSGDITI